MSTLVKCAARTLLVVIIAGFLGATLVRLAPGYGVAEEELDARLNADSVQALRDAHRDRGTIFSFYLRVAQRMLHGDLGFSDAMQEPVRQLIAERFPETLKSVGFGLSLGWAIGLSLAILSVTARSAAVDVGTGLLATLALCTPAAVLALLCVLAQAPGRIVIAATIFPKVFQYGRNLLLKNAALPHVLSAHARGLGRSRIFLRHTVPLAAPQLLAVAGVTVGIAFTTAIPVEALCDMPGIGQLAWKAALARDLELLVILTMIVATVTLVANSTAELLGKAAAHR
ncbi:ABC transporter permease [Acidobacteria bacterium AB60]|nr:ABC transporter permease [Acidobacteria bacterium AB60]